MCSSIGSSRLKTRQTPRWSPDVEHAPVSIQYRFFHHLRQSRMRTHRVHQFCFGGLEIHRDHVALDQLGDLSSDHVRSKERARRLVEDHLHQTLILAERNRLAVSDEWKSADANVDLFLLRRLLGQPDRGNLW